MNRILAGCLASLAVVVVLAGCGLEDALTSHARPVASAAGLEITAGELGEIMANSPIPDTALTEHWTEQIGVLWSDYIRLAALFRESDTTNALDLDRLLEERRYFAVLAVVHYRDSVVLKGIEPTDEEQREFFDTRKPFKRMDIRRIIVSVPESADETLRDSLFAAAVEARALVAGGTDFVEVARDRSSEPAAARGVLLKFQGHDDFAPAADSVVFRLEAGDLSPVIATDTAMLVYQIEKIYEPTFEEARDRSYLSQIEEIRSRISIATVDSLLENARRTTQRGAEPLARRLATDIDARIAPGTRLVKWDGGEFTVDELRRLYLVRPDIRELFAGATDAEIRLYLMELARDAILVQAAYERGSGPTEKEKEELREAMSTQLSRIAQEFGISRNLVVAPAYDLHDESLAFLNRVLFARQPLPWLGEFRVILDEVYAVDVDEQGVRAAAEIARRMREKAAAEADEPSEAEVGEEAS